MPNDGGPAFSPAAILSAYTGVTLCDFGEMKEYIEHVHGDGLFCHSLANKTLVESIQKEIKRRGDFEIAMNALAKCDPVVVNQADALLAERSKHNQGGDDEMDR